MPRALSTPDIVFGLQKRTGNNPNRTDGPTLTVKRAARIGAEMLSTPHECATAMGVTCSYCSRIGTLLSHAANSLLKSKRSRAKGHPNGQRGYSGRDRMSTPAQGSSRMHGMRPGTVANLPRNPTRNPRSEAC